MTHIEQIRQELTWKLRRDILYPEEMIHNMGLEQDDEAIHFGAFNDNQLVGVVSLFQIGTDFQFRKLAIAPALQNTGIGSSLLNYITGYALENGGTRIWCNARVSATGFYLKAGYLQTGRFFVKKGIDYEVMEKVIGG
jgi:GNAT superfamily N-acetyltransferase